jgi:hypothetical protein
MSGPGLSLADLFAHQAPGPKSAEQEAYEQQLRDFQNKATALERDMRRSTVAHAWLLCTCRKWFDWRSPDKPPQAECIVHGGLMISPDGEVLLPQLPANSYQTHREKI